MQSQKGITSYVDTFEELGRGRLTSEPYSLYYTDWSLQTWWNIKTSAVCENGPTKITVFGHVLQKPEDTPAQRALQLVQGPYTTTETKFKAISRLRKENF